MTDFETYKADLADREWQKAEKWLADDRNQQILVSAGVALNWLGDYVANPTIEWHFKEVPISQIRFTGTSPEWNEVLLVKCERDPAKLQDLIKVEPEISQLFGHLPEVGNVPILLRSGENNSFKVLDGMPQFVAAVIREDLTIETYIASNEEGLPHCEAHVVYDLIRGCMRRARDEQSLEALYQSLVLLGRLYGNVLELLQHRFAADRIMDDLITTVVDRAVATLSEPGVDH